MWTSNFIWYEIPKPSGLLISVWYNSTTEFQCKVLKVLNSINKLNRITIIYSHQTVNIWQKHFYRFWRQLSRWKASCCSHTVTDWWWIMWIVSSSDLSYLIILSNTKKKTNMDRLYVLFAVRFIMTKVLINRTLNQFSFVLFFFT